MNEEQELIKDALETVAATGTTGALKSKLMASLRKLDGHPLSPEEQSVIFGILTGRGWIEGHIEPVWHNTRWTLTVKGREALEAM